MLGYLQIKWRGGISTVLLILAVLPNSTNFTRKTRLRFKRKPHHVNESEIKKSRSQITSIRSSPRRVEISTDASISRLGPGPGWVGDWLSGIVVRQDIRLLVPRNSLYSGLRPRRSLYTWPKRSWSSVSEALSFRILRPSHSVRAASPRAINFENLHLLLHAHNFGRQFIAANPVLAVDPRGSLFFRAAWKTC